MSKRFLYISMAIIVICVGITAAMNFLIDDNDTSGVKTAPKNIRSVHIAGNTYRVEIADNEQERRIGLSKHDRLGAGEAMLFVYDEPADSGIWMKDMKFALDILWIDEKNELVHIEEDVKPETYPEIFRSGKNAKYVLEVNAGEVQKGNIQVGQKVSFVNPENEDCRFNQCVAP